MSNNNPIFKGEFVHQLDEKLRFKLPVKMEEVFEEIGLHCVLMKMPERCLALYSVPVWESEYSQFLIGTADGKPGNAESRALSRLLASRSVNMKIGVQGRVAIPDGYKEYIGVGKKDNVVIVGAGDRIEIWSEKEWAEVAKASDDQFFKLLEEASTRAAASSNTEEEE